jgi:sulfonate transport system substrate-binding protein
MKTLIYLSGFIGILMGQAPAQDTVRVGHFPNITHAQGVIGQANGAIEKALGKKIDWKIFNAGPSAMEALSAGHLDIAYVGPNPAINAYIRSEGAALRIVAGASSGGASLVVHPKSNIQSDKDFAGKKITTPQLGNTQDVAAREWLTAHGHQLKDKGGTVTILPIPNPEQLILFQKGEIDAAWGPEPWPTRMIQEQGGKRYLDERDLWPDKKFCTALVVVRKEFLDANPDLVKKFLAAHVELTNWIKANPAEAQKVLNAEIGREIGKPLPDALLQESWKWFEVTYDPIHSSLLKAADSAFKLGFLGKQNPDLSGIADLRLLNEVLQSQKLEPVK